MNAEKIPTKLKKGDPVVVISGKESGKRGKISDLDRVRGRVTIEGVNMVKKTLRKSKEHPQGGVITREAALSISNVMYFDESVNKATRLGWKTGADGSKKRVSKKSGKVID